MFPSPIGELHFSIINKKEGDESPLYRVSVPYRGATFLNSTAAGFNGGGTGFPSPIGELHFSMTDRLFLLRRRLKKVSVPYRGATFLNKFDNFIKKHCTVSVTYRGATFLNFITCMRPLGISLEKVSVPYRGATFLNQFFWRSGRLSLLFPSPIGELHFSIPSPQTRLQSGVNTGIAWQK